MCCSHVGRDGAEDARRGVGDEGRAEVGRAVPTSSNSGMGSV